MKKKFIFMLLATIVAISVVGCNSISNTNHKKKASKKVSLVVDNDDRPKLLKNFRMCNKKVTNSKSLNLNGLSSMNMSGSGALSENSFKLIKERTGAANIVDVDLREESHLFVNGIGISWYGNKDDENINLTQAQVINDEMSKLNKIKQDNTLKIDSKNKKSVGSLSKIDNIKSVQTEEQLASSLGFKYVRFAVPDHKRPQDIQVDAFVKFVGTLPKGTWLHFHCRGGVGRTTTFMVMYDMMKNAKTVSFDDIMKREQLIGGADLLGGQDASSASDAKERTDFIKNFYKYCSQNNDNFKTTWSQWIKTHKS